MDAALATIEKQFGRGAIMKLGSRRAPGRRRHPDRLDRARPGARRRRHPARPDHGDLRPGVVGQDDGLPARHRRGPGARRRRRLHRRRARARSRVRPRLRRQRRRAARQPAGHRRAGARDHRDAHPLRRHRHRRRRLGRGARAARRDRRRDGRLVRRHPGPADEPGPAQADRRRLALEHRARLHQPAAREDRRHVRQPGDDARRPRAQVLRLGAPRHPADRDDQDGHRVGRQPGPGQGREEQGRAAVPRRRVRRHVRRGHLQGGRPARRRRGDGRRHQDRRLVHLRRDPARPGPRGAKEFLKGNAPIAEEIERRIRGQDQRGRRSRSRASKRPNRPRHGR